MVSVVEPATATRTKGRILVVDDELVVRDSLGKWFTSEGYTAKPAGGAREALEILQQMQFDIALIDIKMPGMDGMELQARLKEADPDLTIIIMTGYASVETAGQALKLGADDYIPHPSSPPCRHWSGERTITSPNRWIRMSFRTWCRMRWNISGRGARWTACERIC